MNRNNFFIHVALALVLILIAAFAGQLAKWRNQWRSHVPIVPNTEKKKPATTEEIALTETRSFGRPEVLVKFKSGVSDAAIERLTLGLHDRVEDRIENAEGWEAIDDLDNADAASIVAEYSKLPEVEYAEPNFEISLDEAAGPLVPILPHDPQFNDQWALANSGQRGGKQGADISATLAWATTTGSGKVVVAVLDSGVDYTHEDLAENMWVRPATMAPYHDNELGTVDDLNGYNAIDSAADPMDDNGHGTHCAGIIGAEGENDLGIAGVNWKVQIMPLKFMNAGGFGTTKDAIEAINYAIDRKKKGVNLRVINASWGSTQYSKALEDAIRAAGEEDILFVAAAGNSSTDNDKRAHYPSNYDLPNVMSVAALDRTDSMASFSNFGAKTVHIAAPGREIVSTWLNNSYREASGTSMAAPHVAGVAALVLSKEPNLTVKELRERLLKTTDRLDGLQGKIATGGRLCATRALGLTDSH